MIGQGDYGALKGDTDTKIDAINSAV